MKDKLLFFTILIFISSCNNQINTTDPQNSGSVLESKKNRFFIKKFSIELTTDKSIVLEEAWLEKAWFYEINNNKKIKVAKHGSQLCFKLKPNTSLKYSFKNMEFMLAIPMGYINLIFLV